MVRPAFPSAALARDVRSVPDLAVGGDPAADPRGAGDGVLPSFHGAFSRCLFAGGRFGRRNTQVVAGIGVLQSCPESACRRPGGRRPVRRRVPCGAGRPPFAAGRGRLYRCCGGFDGVRPAVRRPGRQCLPGAGPAFRRRGARRYRGGASDFCGVGAVVAGYGAAGNL